MDSSGVPKKVNRHVFKALDFFTQNKGHCDVTEVLDYVRQCNKNLQPVKNFKNAVQKSLLNLEEAGLVQKFGKGLYRICSVDKQNLKEKPLKDDNKAGIRWNQSDESLYDCDSLDNYDLKTQKRKRSRRPEYSGPPKRTRYIMYERSTLDEYDSDGNPDDDRKSISTQFSECSCPAAGSRFKILQYDRFSSNIDVREQTKNQEKVKLEPIEILDKDTDETERELV